MRLPSVFRRTPFRLTLLFLALFATAASALLLYIYFVSRAEAETRAETGIRRELSTLTAIYRERGMLVSVDGEGSVDEVAERIFAVLDKVERA